MKTLSNKENQQNTPKVSSLYGDYLVMLAAPCILSSVYYGARALAVIAVGVLSAAISDMIFCLFLKRKFLLRDLSNIFIGAAIAVMLPAGVPLYVPAVASAFAVTVAKVPFGGSLKAPFVPAAAGFAFVSICFKEQIFDYSYNSAEKMLGSGSIGSLLLGGNAVHLNAVNMFDIISGNVAGPMGTGCAVLMVACCAYLFVKRRSALLATLGFVAACAVYAAVFPRANAGILTNILLELTSGSLLFGAVFLVTDYATLPKSSISKLIYGIICGFFCMAMRSVGSYEETVCFAVLMANGIRPVFDSALNGVRQKTPSAEKKGGGR